MNEVLLKHAEMIQAVIARLNANSFHVKGWTIAILTALVAVAASVGREIVVLLAYASGEVHLDRVI